MDNLESKQFNSSEIEDPNPDQSENVENGIETEGIDSEANLETEDFDVGDAGQMEKDVVSSAVEKLKNQFGDKIRGLSLKAKQRVGKALVVLFLATTMAGVASAESTYAAELDKDKDKPELVGDRTEPDPDNMLGFELMTEEEANDYITNAMESLKTSGPDGERLVTNEASEIKDNYNVDKQGELPMEAEDVIVRGGSVHISYESLGDNNDFYDNYSAFDEVVNVENVEPAGEPFEINGTGGQPQDAISDALENAGQRMEVSVYGHDYDRATESGDSSQDEYSKHLQTSYEQAIDSYKVLQINEVEQNGVKYFEAKVNVQPGKVV